MVKTDCIKKIIFIRSVNFAGVDYSIGQEVIITNDNFTRTFANQIIQNYDSTKDIQLVTFSDITIQPNNVDYVEYVQFSYNVILERSELDSDGDSLIDISHIPTTITTHSHGNITNFGAIGVIPFLPLITGNQGVIEAGSFGSTANTFCAGDDSRLSNSRPASDVSAWAKNATKPSYTSSEIGLGSVTNDIQTKASIVPNTLPSGGQILIGNNAGTSYVPLSVSGDGALDKNGILTISLSSYLKGGNNTTLLGSIPYQSNVNVTTLLSPNVSATKMFFSQTGTGTNGAIPAWSALAASDIPTLTVSKISDFASSGNALWSPIAGSTSVVTVGTIATGTWNATVIADGKIASALTGKTYNGLSLTADPIGFTIAGGTTSKTLDINNTLAFSGTDGTAFTFPTTSGTLALNTAFTATTSGLVPNPTSSTGRFLKDDGTWAVAAGGGGTTTNALTINNSGTGAASGATFNGSAAITLSYNSIGASPLAGSTSIVTVGTITAGTWTGTAIASTNIASALTGKTYNGLTLTSNATGFSLAGGTTSKTLTINNTLTIAGTDGTTITLPTTSGTVALDSLFTTTVKGLVPAPTSSTGKFLKDDGTWATAGGGSSNLTGSMTIPDTAWSGNTNYTATLTITGAALGDRVVVEVPANVYEAAITAGTTLIINCWVSAVNTVKIWVRTGTYMAVPASSTYYVTVLK